MLVKKRKMQKIGVKKVTPGAGIKDITGTLSKKEKKRIVMKLPPPQAIEIPIEKLFGRTENIRFLMQNIRKSVDKMDPSFYKNAKYTLFFKEKKREAEQKLKRMETGHMRASEKDIESLKRKIRIYERSSNSIELGREQKYLEQFGEFTDKADKIGNKEFFDRLGKIAEGLGKEKDPREFKKHLIEFDRIIEHG